jgi:hypothetical protein
MPSPLLFRSSIRTSYQLSVGMPADFRSASIACSATRCARSKAIQTSTVSSVGLSVMSPGYHIHAAASILTSRRAMSIYRCRCIDIEIQVKEKAMKVELIKLADIPDQGSTIVPFFGRELHIYMSNGRPQRTV